MAHRDATAAPPDEFGALVERIMRAGAARGPLAGLTFVAKDCIDLAGRAPGCGLARRGPGPAPAADAPVITALVEAGAALVGMAQMTPLAFEPSGDNPALGRPLNPRDPERICGGSSSGSAVAVAAGLADFAIGTDTAGSIRIPAQCCGLAGWKPSRGVVPAAGVMVLADSLDFTGFLARGPAVLEPIAAAFGARSHGAFRRLAMAGDAFADSAPALRQAGHAAIEAIGLPTRMVEALPVLRACDEPVFLLLQGEAWRAQRARIETGQVEPWLAQRLAKGAAIDEAALEAARAGLATIAGLPLDAILGEDEVLALPGMPCETPGIAVCDPASPRFSARALYALSAYTRFANGLDLSVVSLPVGRDSAGMPVGLQLVARAGRDADLLALATRLAARLPWGEA